MIGIRRRAHNLKLIDKRVKDGRRDVRADPPIGGRNNADLIEGPANCACEDEFKS